MPTLLTEVLELSTFVVHTFLAPLYKISHISLQFSSIDVANFVTNIMFQFFQSACVCCVHNIFQSTMLPEICYRSDGLLNMMEFLNQGIVLERVFVLGWQTELTNIDNK